MADASPTVLITGAAGFLGRRLVADAMGRGWHVIAAVRNGNPSTPLSGTAKIVDIDLEAPPDRWREVLGGVDIVVHAAARAHVLKETSADPVAAFRSANVSATEKIARAAAEVGVRRVVFVSSIGVHGNTSGDSSFSEASAEAPVTPYAISKKEAEAVLRQVASDTGLEIAMVRPPLVYGPAVKANFLRLIKLVDKGIPAPFGRVKNRRSFIYVDNLADLILAAAIHPKAAGETFVAADDTMLSTPALWRELAQRLGKSARLLPAPVSLLRVAAKAIGQSHVYEQLCESLEVDAAKARQLLGWRPQVSAQAALDATIGWYKSGKTGET